MMKSRSDPIRVLRTNFAIALLASCIVAGCSTTETKDSLSVSGNLEKELASVTFRNRWWNNYEKAAILVRYEEYDAAELSLRSALAKRSKDSRWARTYGLHFIPEYFPNRELGITLYHQSRFNEAESYLELSIYQVFTARAAHYLDRARREGIRESGADNEGPLFTILSPELGSTTGALSIGLVAEVRDPNFVARVTVNGEEYPLIISTREMLLEKTVVLEPGENTITLMAEDLSGNRTELLLQVSTDHDGPAISFDDTAPGQPIQGYVYDPAGVADMTVADRKITLTDIGDGVFSFLHSPVDTPSGEGLSFEVRDVLGNVTRGPLPNQTQQARVALALNGPIESLQALENNLLHLAVEENLSGPRISFTNLTAGQRYLSDEIAVGILAEGLEPLERIELNGISVPGLIPGRRIQRITRRLGLAEPGSHLLVARVTDTKGEVSTASVSIERRLPTLFNESDRLSVSVLGNSWHGLDFDSEAISTLIAEELVASLSEGGRFNLLDRESISLVLSEQELSAALSSPANRVRLGRLQPVDYFLIGEVRRFGANMEVLLHVIRTETGDEIIVDVYGPANSVDEISALVGLLGLRLEQQFPRVRGMITRVRSSGKVLTSSLSKKDLIRASLPCIVYREVEIFDPQSQQSLGVDWLPIAEGIFSEVRRDDSVVRLTGVDGAESPTDRDYVISK